MWEFCLRWLHIVSAAPEALITGSLGREPGAAGDGPIRSATHIKFHLSHTCSRLQQAGT